MQNMTGKLYFFHFFVRERTGDCSSIAGVIDLFVEFAVCGGGIS
jgi:hypothetical protein